MASMKIEPKAEQNLDGYGAPLIPWSKVRERLEQAVTQAPETGGPDRHTYWLATVHPDGMAPSTSLREQIPARRRTWHSTLNVSSPSPLKISISLWKVGRAG